MLGTLVSSSGTLGGSSLASWSGFWTTAIAFVVICIVLFVLGRPADPPWPMLNVLSRIPRGLTRVTGFDGWAAVAVGMGIYGLLFAGSGFYSDVSWHIALGRDDALFTAPHTGILVGLVMILGAAVLGTFVATMDRVDGLRLGALRIPRSLLPLWALGIGAVAGFPLDDVWHATYGVDVTMWSPTHMLMILGATFTPLALWLVLAEAGVRADGGRWGRGTHLVVGWLAVTGLAAPLGEFQFGVPQFSLLFAPILVTMAAGLGLVAFRLVHGRWWTAGFAVVTFLLQLGPMGNSGGGPVATRTAATLVVSGVVVEVVGLLLGTERRLRFALVSGLGIGTLGLAGEWAWNQHAWQPWRSAMLPEAAILALVAALGTALLGAAFGGAVLGDAGRPRLPRAALVAAGIACLTVLVLPLRRPTGDVQAAVHVEPAGQDAVLVTATLTPADAADSAYWFQTSAWQGGGLELSTMEPTGRPGEYRSSEPVPVGGHWKSILRLHRGAEMMAVPIFLPADPDIDEPEIPAVDRTVPFASERDYLLRETHSGTAWMAPAVHLFLVLVSALWIAAFVMACGWLLRRDDPADGASTPSGRRSVAAAGRSSAVAAAAAAGPGAPPTPA